MISVIKEIAALRGGLPIVVDYSNRNRYRLVVLETDGSKTAYYFSTPIYNQKNRKLVDMKFHVKDNAICSVGSNANITIDQNVIMKNAEGTCMITIPQKPVWISDQVARGGNCTFYPIVNGVAIQHTAKGNESIQYIVEVNQPYLEVIANDRCIALMKDQLRPLVVFSCIGSMDEAGNVISSAKMEYKKLTHKKYCISLFPTSSLAHSVLLEANLYEKKLFQDTTVESFHPETNNVFGGIGFIGSSSSYGEQWLYTRLDCSKMPEMMDKRIRKAHLHMPKLNSGSVTMSAFKVVARFCSFGSNWDNKIADGGLVSDSIVNGRYYTIDVSSSLLDSRTRTLQDVEGLILKPKVKGTGFSVIATADSYYAPQILELNYR